MEYKEALIDCRDTNIKLTQQLIATEKIAEERKNEFEGKGLQALGLEVLNNNLRADKVALENDNKKLKINVFVWKVLGIAGLGFGLYQTTR